MGRRQHRIAPAASAALHRFVNEGMWFADSGRHEEALGRFRAAWALIPVPQEDWCDADVVLLGLGDCYFHLGRYAEGRDIFRRALDRFGVDSIAYVKMRLGQCLFELGDQEAVHWLLRGFIGAGRHQYSREDPRYIDAIRAAMEGGGWAEELRAEIESGNVTEVP